MTDQVYHQVQYPLKKSISLLKKVNLDGEDVGPINLTQDEKEEIESFLKSWENERARIVDFVTDLRQISRTLI